MLNRVSHDSRNHLRFLLVLIFPLVSPVALWAGDRESPSGRYIRHDVMANGGGLVTAGQSSIIGTIGQVAAGHAESPQGETLYHGVNPPSESGAEGESEGEGEGPLAGFLATPVSGAAPLTVHFTDLSVPGSHPITEWEWSFGDGGVSWEQNPVHVYDSQGVFSACLTVTTEVGFDTRRHEGCVTASAPMPTVGLAGIICLLGLAALVGASRLRH